MNVGFKFKIITMVHRLIASYFRALAAGCTTLGIGHGVDATKGAILPQIGVLALGSLIAPGIVFLSETADALDGSKP